MAAQAGEMEVCSTLIKLKADTNATDEVLSAHACACICLCVCARDREAYMVDMRVFVSMRAYV